MCVGASVGLVCTPNPPAIVCSAVNLIFKGVLYILLKATMVAYQVLDHNFEKATLGENHLYCLMFPSP